MCAFASIATFASRPTSPLSRRAPGPDGIDRRSALAHARRTWAACAPMNAWLDRQVGESELPAVSRYRTKV
jgi:hypothetical protein